MARVWALLYVLLCMCLLWCSGHLTKHFPPTTVTLSRLAEPQDRPLLGALGGAGEPRGPVGGPRPSGRTGGVVADMFSPITWALVLKTDVNGRVRCLQ